MASDSCWSCGGTVDTLANKMERLSGGALVGTAGQGDCRPLVALLDKVRTPAGLPSYEAISAVRSECLALVVLPKGRIFKIATTIVSPGSWDDSTGIGMWEIAGTFTAIGSGSDLALVAMECGKSARDAVRIACKYDTASRPPVHVMELNR